jgi:predicted O-linked N-acetylglucosamine transferase (SPINDLY family)
VNAKQAQDVRRAAMELHRAGRFAEAVDAWSAAAKLDPAHPETQNNRGVALQAMGKLNEASAAFSTATKLRPTYADAWENFAGVLLELNRFEEAIDAAQQLAGHVPGASSHIVLATALARAARFEEAAASAQTATQIDSAMPEAWYCLASIRAAQERWADAKDAFTQVIQLSPQALPAHVNLGVCCAAMGKLEEAAHHFRQAIKLDENCADAALRLSNVLDQLGLQQEALAAAQRAAQLRPDAASLNLLASLSDKARKPTEAEMLYRRALQLDPSHPPALANYAAFLARRGRIEQAVPMLRGSIDAAPGEPVPHSTLCMYLNAMPGVSAREVFEEHWRWAERHARPLSVSIAPHSNSRDPDRRLRIGYVSPDWAGHPVARFMQPILEAHDHSIYEIHIYDDSIKSDAFTEQMKPLADVWHRVRGMADAPLAQKIRADGIDILVDLAGHTADNRLLTFARKPAPIQVSYCGYPNTSGLDTIDYRLTDALADPVGLADELHSEKLVRLPHSFLTFRPPVQTPDVSALPSGRNGFVTFGSFNALWKINQTLLELWKRLLDAVPGSRLIIKADGLEDPNVAQRITKSFGVDRPRLELREREATYAGHMSLYGLCDICLDSFPYAGTTTSCEALWMGVPMITLAGQSHASRVGVSLLHSVGLHHLIAYSPDEFVAIAATLASDVQQLRDIRQNLRTRLLRSPLASPRTRDIELAYRQMWREWCAS